MKSETEIKTLIVIMGENLKESKSRPTLKSTEEGIQKMLFEMHLEKAISLMEWVLK